jgi:hypothetical protein
MRIVGSEGNFRIVENGKVMIWDTDDDVLIGLKDGRSYHLDDTSGCTDMGNTAEIEDFSEMIEKVIGVFIKTQTAKAVKKSMSERGNKVQ